MWKFKGCNVRMGSQKRCTCIQLKYLAMMDVILLLNK